MLDTTLRPLKDAIFNPLCRGVPTVITPLHITILAFASGSAACVSAALGRKQVAVSLWLLNRALDCLDGALARFRGQSSDLGGFLDLLSDFIVYSAIPICCALGRDPSCSSMTMLAPVAAPDPARGIWLAVAIVEACFHINNFVLFYVGAVLEKRKAAAVTSGSSSVSGLARVESERAARELTSIAMRPALVEGFESGIVFTIMLALPTWTESLCWALVAGVSIGITQRVRWVCDAM